MHKSIRANADSAEPELRRSLGPIAPLWKYSCQGHELRHHLKSLPRPAVEPAAARTKTPRSSNCYSLHSDAHFSTKPRPRTPRRGSPPGSGQDRKMSGISGSASRDRQACEPYAVSQLVRKSRFLHQRSTVTKSTGYAVQKSSAQLHNKAATRPNCDIACRGRQVNDLDP